LNVGGYWDPLLAMLDRIAEQGFMTAEHRGLLFADSDAVRLLDRLATWRPPTAFAGSRP
jgi:hypothetical protein